MDSTYEIGLNLIVAVSEKLADEKQKNFFENVVSSIKVAKEEANDEEKQARLIDAVVKYANQASFLLFRQNGLSEEMANTLRSIPTPEETAEEVKKFNDDRQKRIDEINEKHLAILEEEKALDVFTGIIAGMTKKEAQDRMEEHEKQIREAAKANA